MQTKLRIDGANCSTCFNQTLDDLANLDGVRSVHGSVAGPCIEVDHDVDLETLTAVIANRLHGVEMFANEVRMVPLEAVVISSCACSHDRPS
jgi:copper chaperone CopZ